jgi:S1-C subfamily serine protease
MKTPLFWAALGLLALESQSLLAADDLRESVVQIHSTIRQPNVFEPWAKQSPDKGSGTGVVIEGNRVLTNAHMVNYAAEVLIQPFESGEKSPVKIIGIAPGIDLALLEPVDKTVLAKRRPMPRAEKLPAARESVSCYGYPLGGDELSITKGIISRIEFADYYYSQKGLRVQVDAALNPGNSGGPALVDDKMIGIAFSGLRDSDNIGYLIPNEEIDLFVKDLADGKYDGKRSANAEFQSLENASLRATLGMSPAMTGVLVSSIRHSTDAATSLQPRDVLMKIDGRPIDNLGDVRGTDGFRCKFPYFAEKWAKDNAISATVLRGGKTLDLNVKLEAKRRGVTNYLDGANPSYLVYGPFAFSTASRELILRTCASTEWCTSLLVRNSPLVTRGFGEAAFPGEELVTLVAVFPHKLSEGYDEFQMCVLSEINGVAVKNLKHAAQLIRDAKDKTITFQFAERTRPVAVFDRQAVADATEDILADNGVRQPCSADLREIWLGKEKPAADPAGKK